MSTLGYMLFVLIQIYIIISAQTIQEYKNFSQVMLYIVIDCLIKLNANCLINDCVYEESNRLLAVIDSIDVKSNKYSERDFREIMLFKALSQSPAIFGFTIGGFMPFRKTTLLSVCNL